MRAVKRIVFGVFVILVSPLVLATWLEKRVASGEQVFAFCTHLLAILPGLPGTYARGAYYFGVLDNCSWETHVGFGTVFTHRSATLRRGASVGCYCVIGHADIGEGVMMGSRVSVPSGKRQHLGEVGGPSSDVRHFDRVSIGEGSWIGEGAIVLADVGRRCIVSAGAVVTGPAPDDSVVGGNPARVLRAKGQAAAVPGEA